MASWTRSAWLFRTLGLNGHLDFLDPGGSGLVIRSVVLDCAGLAEVERVLGRAVVGARIGLDTPTRDRRVAQTRRAARVEAPLWWARPLAPSLCLLEPEAIADLVRLGEVTVVPVVAGGRTLGVLTVWAWRLSGGDAAATELLRQAAGGVLLRLGGGAGGGAPPAGVSGVPSASRPAAVPV